MTGLRNRMGQRTKQDAAVSIEVMQLLMQKFEALCVASAPDSDERLRITRGAAFSMYSFCGSLRGYEVPKIVLTYLREFRVREPVGTIPRHIGLPLAGKFKLRGNMDQCLLLFVAAETASGLKPLLWTDRLVDLMEQRGVVSGWAFADERGRQLPMSAFEDTIFDLLLETQSQRPDLIPEGIEVCEDYGLARSFRRGATTRAENCGVPETLIDYMNRWKESKDGGDPYFQGSMRVHCADQRQMAEKFLKFSRPL